MVFSNAKWIRLYTTLLEAGQIVLLSILHRYLPRDDKLLYQNLNTVHKATLKKLRNKNVLKDEQWKLIFPLNKETDSSAFDLTLISVLIQNCTTLPPPRGGWKIKTPAQGDNSIAANIIKLRILRNKLTHNLSLHLMSTTEFNKKWAQLELILTNLDYLILPGVLSFSDMKKRVLDPNSAAYMLAESRYQIFVTDLKYKFGMLSLIVLLPVLLLLIHRAFIHYSIRKASIELKNYYNTTIGQKLMRNLGTGKHCRRFNVDLNVVNENAFNKMFSQSDSIDYHKTKHMEPVHGIKIAEILGEEKHKFVLIRGVGGMGKTHLSEQIALDWSLGTLWQDFSFVFLIKCRELNHIATIDSVEELLTSKFPQVFAIISLDQFVSYNIKFLMIVDGIDELTAFNKDESNSLMRGFFDLVNPNNEQLYKRKLIVTGRPGAINKFKNIHHSYSSRNIDITGFNRISINAFIQNYFHEKLDLRKNVLSVVESSNNMQLMARIPVYLNMICSLYENHKELENVKTATELNVWQLSLFIRGHMSASNSNKLKSGSIGNVFRDPDIHVILSRLAQISFDMLLEGKAVFETDDTEEVELYDKMEEAGLVMHTVSIAGKIRYQFYHLTMQEFLAAVYLCISHVKSSTVATGLQDRHSFHAHYAGLQGGLIPFSNSSFIVKMFAKHLKFIHWKQNYEFLESIGSLKLAIFFKCYFEYQNKLHSAPFFWNVEFTKGLDYHSFQYPRIYPEHYVYFLKEEPGVIDFLNLDYPLVYLMFSHQLNYNQSMEVLNNQQYFEKAYIPASELHVDAVTKFCDDIYIKGNILKLRLYAHKNYLEYEYVSLTPWLSCLRVSYSFHLMAPFKNNDQYTQTVLNLCQHLTGKLQHNISLKILSVLDFFLFTAKVTLDINVLRQLSKCLPLIDHLDVSISELENLNTTILDNKNDKMFIETTLAVLKASSIALLPRYYSIVAKRNNPKKKSKRFWFGHYQCRDYSRVIEEYIYQGVLRDYFIENVLYNSTDITTLPRTLRTPKSSYDIGCPPHKTKSKNCSFYPHPVNITHLKGVKDIILP